MAIWHYTVVKYLGRIVKDGVIKPATIGVEKSERPVVWFSTNPIWEETANEAILNDFGKRVGLNKEETHVMGGGLARICVGPETAPYDWDQFKRQSGISTKLARGMYKVAIGQGARPSEWRVSFEPVLREKWLSIETWNGEQWEAAG